MTNRGEIVDCIRRKRGYAPASASTNAHMHVHIVTVRTLHDPQDQQQIGAKGTGANPNSDQIRSPNKIENPLCGQPLALLRRPRINAALRSPTRDASPPSDRHTSYRASRAATRAAPPSLPRSLHRAATGTPSAVSTAPACATMPSRCSVLRRLPRRLPSDGKEEKKEKKGGGNKGPPMGSAQ